MNTHGIQQKETVAHIIYDNSVILSNVIEVSNESGVFNYGLPEIPLSLISDIKIGDEFVVIIEIKTECYPCDYYVCKAVCNGFHASHTVDWIDYVIIPIIRKQRSA